jgi:hypothetical protein
MSTNELDRELEAWKILCDLAKTLIAIASAILAAILGYYLTGHQQTPKTSIYVPPILIVGSMVFSIYGIGRVFRFLKTHKQQASNGILHLNIAAAFLIIGILSCALLKESNELSIDKVLSEIERQTTVSPGNFSFKPEHVESLEVTNNNVSIVYKTPKGSRTVVYSITDARVRSIK